MGIIFSCCRSKGGDAEERMPLKTNKGGSGGIILGKNGQNDQVDDFVIDPEIQKFLDNFSSDDDGTGGHDDDDFEDDIIQEDDENNKKSKKTV